MSSTLEPKGRWVLNNLSARRLMVLAKGSVPVRLDDMVVDWRSVPSAQKHYTQLLGVGGTLAHLWTRMPRIRERYREGGWLAVMAEFALTLKDPRLSIGSGAFLDVSAGFRHGRILISGRAELDLRTVVFEAVLLERWQFVPEWCSHAGHWYFRHTVGRPPEACPVHSRAARQAKWRVSPARRRKGAKSELTQGEKTRGKATRSR
jgi:hypothetical protein